MVAPGGTVTTIFVGESRVIAAGVPLNVTVVPAGPSCGLKSVTKTTAKRRLFVAVPPPPTATCIGPATAPLGTATVISVGETIVGAPASTPPKVTSLAPAKPVPLMSTMVPTRPPIGENVLSVGVTPKEPELVYRPPGAVT